jgi:hypothetical protein
MASEVEEEYSLENSIAQYQVLETVGEFHKTHGHYPARVILNPKHQHIGVTSFVQFPIMLAPAIEPLGNRDIKAREASGYHVDIEYNEGIDEKVLICRGFAKIS